VINNRTWTKNTAGCFTKGCKVVMIANPQNHFPTPTPSKTRHMAQGKRQLWQLSYPESTELWTPLLECL
jgi:hypothetical protein